MFFDIPEVRLFRKKSDFMLLQETLLTVQQMRIEQFKQMPAKQ